MVRRYKAPWIVQTNLDISISATGQEKVNLTCNDERINLHNASILSIWRANVDC